MSEQRFIEIETKLAHQEHTMIELNKAVTQQQQTISKLEHLCASMAERITSLNDAQSVARTTDEPPPHY